MNLFEELRKRNVFRVGVAYVVTAWLVIQVVETILPAFGFSDAAVRYVTIAFAIGIVPVLVLSWVFEWTPEGLRRDSEVDDSARTSVLLAKRLDRMILVVLALALGYFAFDKFVLAPQREATVAEQARQEGRSEALVESYGDQSIAVLAFDDMSPEGDQEYLSDGLAEEILNLLVQIPDLRVISRSSAFSFKGKDTPIPEIARILNVAHVLEGSVRKAGDRIRVTAQLIDARSDTHIWSNTYDRTLDDIFAIQDELAAAMVDELEITLRGDLPRAKRVDPEAYMLYLEGRRLVAFIDVRRAAQILERAVEIEPEFADAWAALCRAYFILSPTAMNKDHEGDEFWSKLTQAKYRLAAIDPDHSWLLIVQAWEAVSLNRDYASAARLVERGLARHANNWDMTRMAIYFASWIRRDDIALRLAQDAVKRDPLCTDCSYVYSRQALNAGEYEEAENEILRFRALIPSEAGRITLGTARLLGGDVEGARDVFTPAPEDRIEAPEYIAFTETFGDLLIRAWAGADPELISEIDEFAAGDVEATDSAQLYAVAGAVDKAFDRLHEAADSMTYEALARDLRLPLYRNLHGDPRWLELQEIAGVAPHQLEGLEFNPRLPD